MVIHFTDGLDGDLADLQKVSEELRQEGTFRGFLNGKWRRQWGGRCTALLGRQELLTESLGRAPPWHLDSQLPAWNYGKGLPKCHTYHKLSPGTSPTGSQTHSGGATSIKHGAIAKGHEDLLHLAISDKLGINL